MPGMTDIQTSPDADPEIIKPPYIYEIRVQGSLAPELWTSWFEDLAVSTARGETTLRGSAADRAALYGLLARLRDQAVPLLAVRVLDADAQRKLTRQSRRYDLLINLLLVGAYLALLGGLATMTVLLAPLVNTALALAVLFALLGALAHAFWLWSGQAAWRWITYLAWPAAALTLLIFIPLSGLLPPALGIGLLLFILAGGLLYLIYALRRRAEDIAGRLAGHAAPAPALPVTPDDPAAGE